MVGEQCRLFSIENYLSVLLKVGTNQNRLVGTNQNRLVGTNQNRLVGTNQTQ